MTKTNGKKSKKAGSKKAANGNASERKPKQLEIQGTERKRIPELDDLAEAFREARDTWMADGQAMADAKDALHEGMKKHGETKYRYLDSEGDEEEAFIEDKIKIGVRKIKNAKAKDDE